eukprot:CAMPEP_0172507092 /NCGR_PEP_ID=MMETSP1066-20121228/201208_1 /TAXON_ID=671091 /ORGANISM="Coscinodiscus wailesii, Strain CCMP2513" /LENGTH=136 /DNA_ID=CAMNT_0013284481 /DNA_START=199 /DNA_END=605 /DNA_ORIENTATION=-
MPPGDILIHAGDYTLFGKYEEAVDFNAWLGTLNYDTVVLVHGNHDANASWKKDADAILSNATILNDQSLDLDGFRIHGTQFFWPCRWSNPSYELISPRTDVVIAHGPAYGFVDNDCGCRALRRAVERVKPRLVVSG